MEQRTDQTHWADSNTGAVPAIANTPETAPAWARTTQPQTPTSHLLQRARSWRADSRWFRVLALAGVFLAGAMLYTEKLRPQFQSVAVVEIAARPGSTADQDLAAHEAFAEADLHQLDAWMEQMRGRDFARRVMEGLSAWTDHAHLSTERGPARSEPDAPIGTGPREMPLRLRISHVLTTPPSLLSDQPPASTDLDDVTRMPDPEAAIDELMNAISVRHSGDPRRIEIVAQHTSAKEAARLANAMAREFVATLALRRRSARTPDASLTAASVPVDAVPAWTHHPAKPVPAWLQPRVEADTAWVGLSFHPSSAGTSDLAEVLPEDTPWEPMVDTTGSPLEWSQGVPASQPIDKAQEAEHSVPPVFNEPSATLVSKARPAPTIHMPYRLVCWSLGLFVGVLAGMLMTHRRNPEVRRLQHPGEARSELKISLLGSISHTPVPQWARDASAMSQVHTDPVETNAEAFRYLAQAIQGPTAEGLTGPLLVTSCAVGDGKTTVAIGLARQLAREGHSVLLIDANLCHPKVHQALELPNERGLTSLLFDGSPPDSLFLSATVPNLRVLTAGPPSRVPLKHLVDPRVFQLLAGAETFGFTRVVIDGPALQHEADALVLASYASQVVLVLKSDAITANVARRAIDRLQEASTALVGMVWNQVPAP